jgi:MFS family permease
MSSDMTGSTRVADSSPAPSSAPSPVKIAVIGGLCMATAMGIGRFAFTPLLPLMQQTQGLRLSDGAWLALSNYLGYLLGAVMGFAKPPKPGSAARWGVVLVAVSTLAMAVTFGMPAWLALRFVSGIASALVMIGVAGWALVQLATARRSELGGWVFGCVGIGIAIAGVIVIVVGTTVADPQPAWFVLGLIASAIAVATWRPLMREPATTTTSVLIATPISREAWLLIVCYGVAGFGYIVPATFLPAVARALVNDPAIFGWVWPAFGAAAAIGTIGVFTFLPKAAPRKVCATGMFVMAIGTAAPVIHLSLTTLIVSAICVGGSFIVVTLAGLQEARRIAHVAPARAVAGMTSSFALGQLAGPLLAHAGESAATAMHLPSAIATVALVVSASILLIRRPDQA